MDTTVLKPAEAAWLQAWRQGPLRTRWTSLPVQNGDPAPDIRLPDSEGASVFLSSFWRDGPAVLVFLRHYGCSCAASRLERLAAELPRLREEKATVVVIGQGEPGRARDFKRARGLDAVLLCDPDRQAYAAYGLLEATPPQVVYGAPDAFLRREFAAGEGLQQSRLGTPRAPVDNPWQLPGDFVIDRGGRLRFAHRPAFCDGQVDTDVLIAALRIAALETR